MRKYPDPAAPSTKQRLIPQLDLFPDAPLCARLPRRLRLMGFELELLERDAGKLADFRRELEREEVKLAGGAGC
jgi:hypothetical protein